MILHLEACPAWELDKERDGERRVKLGSFDPEVLGVDPVLTLIVSRESADKARQIGTMLILAGESLEPTGLEVTRDAGRLG